MRWFAAMLCLFIFTSAYAMENKTAEVQILSLADIHFDPFVYCRYKVSCPLIKSLRAAPASEWPAIFNKYAAEKQQYREDSNYALLVSALTAAKQAAEKNHVKAVIILGDFLGHDYRSFYKHTTWDFSYSGYQDFVRKTMTFLTNEIEKAFPQTNVYVLLGNNDSYRGDYLIDQGGAFFHDNAQLFARLIQNPANKTALLSEFPTGGYYAVTLLPDTRLLMLNSVLFSSKEKQKEAQQLAENEFAWLHQQLLTAKERHQHVMIAMHVPVGIDVYATLKYRLFRIVEFWDPDYVDRFEAELKTFSPEIVAIFAGHLHSDWFQMLQIDNRNTIPVTGTPSISPIFGNNPGFKIYQYAPAEGRLINFETYYYPLDKQADWGVEYSFDKIYQPNCQRCTLPDGFEHITPSNQLANYYKRFYAVSTDSQPIKTKWMPYYWCATKALTTTYYKKCIE